jgi:caffeoyl-CoA O-methyltransferase
MDALESYISTHSTGKNPALDWLERETNLHTRAARMLSGESQARLLSMISEMVRPHAVLEVGTFTGYSAIALAAGIPPDGRLDSVEIDDELQKLILAGWKKAGISSIAHLHIGDAMEVVPTLDFTYDIAYIDADKRLYPEFYRLIFPKVRRGGYILADNVLWSGKVALENPPKDKQTSAIMEFNDIVAADPRVENFIIPLRDGLNVVKIL